MGDLCQKLKLEITLLLKSKIRYYFNRIIRTKSDIVYYEIFILTFL